MSGLFVDTGGWHACADESDPAHGDACRARDGAMTEGLRLVTTDYVVDETLTLLRTRLGLHAAEDWWRRIGASPRLRLEWIDAGRAERARHEFFRHRDKDYSFTDCTSLVVMRELGLRRVLTTDRHFAQMGFEILPAGAPGRRH